MGCHNPHSPRISDDVKLTGNIEDGKRLAAKACAECHGDAGVSPNATWPSLAGFSAAYLVRITTAYKTGDQQDVAMTPIAKKLSDKDIQDVSAYYASLSCGSTQAGTGRGDVAAGQSLAKNCTRCHGETGIPTIRSWPLLAGQAPGYLANVLKSFRAGLRKNPMMADHRGQPERRRHRQSGGVLRSAEVRSGQVRRGQTMTKASDLASAARRRFLNGLGLAVTCTGAITGAAALGFSGIVSAKADTPAPGGKPDAARKAARSRRRTTTGRSTAGRSAWTSTSASAACAASRPARPRTTFPRNAHQFRTWVERYVHIEGEHAARIDSHQDPVNIAASGSEKEYRFADRYKGAKVDKAFFVPKLCNQCSNPACVQVCPVGATYKTEDGVVLVDEKRCIGCRYCVQACPYGARYFDERRGVPDKCTWCYHRITKGMQPACVDSCPTGRASSATCATARARSACSCAITTSRF